MEILPSRQWREWLPVPSYLEQTWERAMGKKRTGPRIKTLFSSGYERRSTRIVAVFDIPSTDVRVSYMNDAVRNTIRVVEVDWDDEVGWVDYSEIDDYSFYDTLPLQPGYHILTNPAVRGAWYRVLIGKRETFEVWVTSTDDHKRVADALVDRGVISEPSKMVSAEVQETKLEENDDATLMSFEVLYDPS